MCSPELQIGHLSRCCRKPKGIVDMYVCIKVVVLCVGDIDMCGVSKKFPLSKSDMVVFNNTSWFVCCVWLYCAPKAPVA